MIRSHEINKAIGDDKTRQLKPWPKAAVCVALLFFGAILLAACSAGATDTASATPTETTVVKVVTVTTAPSASPPTTLTSVPPQATDTSHPAPAPPNMPVTPSLQSRPTPFEAIEPTATVANAGIDTTPTAQSDTGSSSGSGGGSGSNQAASAQVAIVEPPFKPPDTWSYDPKVITVTVGTRITWTNKGAVLHTVTTDNSNLFDSGDLPPGATFSYTPTQLGTITYVCIYHSWMKGTIIVAR